MAILFMDAHQGDAETWQAELRRNLPDDDVRLWPDELGDAADIDFAVIGLPERGVLASLPNLRAALSTWAGADRLMGEGLIPPGLPLVRLIDPALTIDMTHFAVHWGLHFHRHIYRYREFQAQSEWRKLPYPEAAQRRIGVMGLGVLGGDAAAALARLGFDVAGWDEVTKTIEGVTAFVGSDGFQPFLERTEILIILLPLTPETEGIIDRDALAALPEGAYVISIARGGHLVDEDLLAALDSGHIEAAALDTFRTEPLPTSHPFWSHPRIYLTPHVASETTPRTAAVEIAEDIRRIRAGQPPRNTVDMTRGF